MEAVPAAEIEFGFGACPKPTQTASAHNGPVAPLHKRRGCDASFDSASSARGIRATSSRSMAPRSPCPSCSLAMVVYEQRRVDKRAREEEEEEASTSSSSVSKRPRQEVAAAASASSSVGGAGVVVLDVQPINAAPPQQPPPAPPLQPPVPARPVPPCLREHFLPALGLRPDLPIHFIDEKVVTSTDMNPHQNRFRLPWDGVDHNLKPILNLAELESANLLKDMPPKKRPPKPKKPGEGGEAAQDGEKIKKPKKKGEVHGGLRVKLVDLTAGAKELLMTRWGSSQGTVVKGEGFTDFIRRCSFRENDAVDIWAFVQRRLRLFGVDVCDDSVLHVFVVKQHQPPQRCCYCPPIPHAH